jgi:hypothetical protein
MSRFIRAEAGEVLDEAGNVGFRRYGRCSVAIAVRRRIVAAVTRHESCSARARARSSRSDPWRPFLSSVPFMTEWRTYLGRAPMEHHLSRSFDPTQGVRNAAVGRIFAEG